jgi:hypothetical protein
MTFKNVFIFGGLSALTAQAFAGNVVTNAGFETGDMTGWTTSAFTATNNDKHTGVWSAIDFGNFSLEQSFAPVAVTDVTEFSVWVKQPNLTNFFFAFEALYSDSSIGSFLGSTGSGATWTKFDFTSQLDSSKSLSGVRGYGYSSGGTNDVTFYDDFMVNTNAVPEPASFAVLGLGAVALMRRRRK